jgi:hypothetical protein
MFPTLLIIAFCVSRDVSFDEDPIQAIVVRAPRPTPYVDGATDLVKVAVVRNPSETISKRRAL